MLCYKTTVLNQANIIKLCISYITFVAFDIYVSYKREKGDIIMSNISQEEILNYLKNNGSKTLTEIRNYLDKDAQKPIVLYHLRKLIDLGKIVRNDDKTYKYYSGQNVSLVKIPCFGEAKAGIDAKIRDNEDPDYFVAVPPCCLKGYNPKDLFIMQISGDSMEPTLYDGIHVIFKKEIGSIPKDNDVVLYKVNQEELKVKRFKYMGDYAILWSDNFKKYEPLEINEESDSYLGKMISIIN